MHNQDRQFLGRGATHYSQHQKKKQNQDTSNQGPVAPITKAGEQAQFQFDFGDEKEVNYLDNNRRRSKSQGHSSDSSQDDGGQRIYREWEDGQKQLKPYQYEKRSFNRNYNTMTREPKEIAVQQWHNKSSSGQSRQGGYQSLYSPHQGWSYDDDTNTRAKNVFHGHNQIQDEENTPKPKYSTSQMQDHYESAQKTKSFPKEFYKSSNRSGFEYLTSRQEQSIHMSDRLSDLNQVDDEVFALSDRNSKSNFKLSIQQTTENEAQQRFKKTKPSQLGHTHSSGDLNRNMSDLNYQLDQETAKQWLDGTFERSTMQQTDQSAGFTSTGVGPQNNDMQYKSNFGKEYMVQQQKQLQNRKDYKIASGMGVDASSEKDRDRRIYNQLQDRKNKNIRPDTEHHQNQGGQITSLMNGLFNEEGRKNHDKLMRQDSEDEEDIKRKYSYANHYQQEALGRQSNFLGNHFLDDVVDTVHPQQIHNLAMKHQASRGQLSLQQNMFKSQIMESDSYDHRERGQGYVGSDYYNLKDKNFQHKDHFSTQRHRTNIGMNLAAGAPTYMANHEYLNQYNIHDKSNMSAALVGNQIGEAQGKIQDMKNAKFEQKKQKMNEYFFESANTKYFSLKKFTEELFDYRDFSLMSGSVYNRHNQEINPNALSLNDWFLKLHNHEKSIGMTIVDPDMVSLIKCMHNNLTEYNHGTFEFSEEQNQMMSTSDGRRYEPVYDYNQLKFMKSEMMITNVYDTYGTRKTTSENERIKKIRESEDNLVRNIKLIKIDDKEAFTLSNYIIENTEFLLTQLRTILPDFLVNELKADKYDAKLALKNSVFQKKLELNGKKDEQSYYLMHKNESKIGSDDSIQRQQKSSQNNPGLQSKYGTSAKAQVIESSKDKNKVTLAYMLAVLFERALNINYLEFKNKVTNDKMRRQLFLEPQGGIHSTTLWTDMKLCLFWRDFTEQQIDNFWVKVKDQEVKILEAIKLTDQFKKQQSQFATINEELEEEDEEKIDDVARYGGENNTSSDEAQEQKWTNRMQNRVPMSNSKMNNKKYLHFNDDEDIERGRLLESQGYRQLPQESHEPPILDMIRGKGVSAIDDSASESNNSDQDNYKNLPIMKKRTTVFQNIKQKDHPSSNSDYENDNFYSEQEEYQDDDDFSLPPGHFQNQPTKNTVYSTIQELKEMKYKEKHGKSEEDKQPLKQQTELTSTNATTTSKKRKKNKKKTNEEEKTLKAEETPQSKMEAQKLLHLKKQFQKIVSDFQTLTQKLLTEKEQIKIEQQKDAEKDTNSLVEISICNHYMFIRLISTYKGLPTTKNLTYVDNVATSMTIDEIVQQRIHDLVYELILQMFQKKLDQSVDDLPEEVIVSKKKNKKNKKKKNPNVDKQEDKEKEVQVEKEKDQEDEKQEPKKKNKKNKKKKKQAEQPLVEEEKKDKDVNETIQKTFDQIAEAEDILEIKDKTSVIKKNLIENQDRLNNLQEQDLLSKSASQTSLQGSLSQYKAQLELAKQQDAQMTLTEKNQLNAAYQQCGFSDASSFGQFNLSEASEDIRIQQEQVIKAKEWKEQSRGLLSGNPNNRYKDELTEQFKDQIDQMEKDAWDVDGDEAKEMGYRYNNQKRINDIQHQLGLRMRSDESIERAKQIAANDQVYNEQIKLLNDVKQESQPSQGFTGLKDLKEEELDNKNRNRYTAEADKVLAVDEQKTKKRKQRRKGPKKTQNVEPAEDTKQELLKNERLLEAHLKAEHKADSDEEDVNVVVAVGDDAYFDDNWYEKDLDKPGTPDKELNQWEIFDNIETAERAKRLQKIKDLKYANTRPRVNLDHYATDLPILPPKEEDTSKPLDMSDIILSFGKEVDPMADKVSSDIIKLDQTKISKPSQEVSVEKSKEKYREGKFITELTSKIIQNCIQGQEQEDEPQQPIKNKKKSKQEKRKDAKLDQNRRKQEQIKLKEQEQEKKKKEQLDKKSKQPEQEVQRISKEQQETQASGVPQIEKIETFQEQIALPTTKELNKELPGWSEKVVIKEEKKEDEQSNSGNSESFKREREEARPLRLSSRGTSKASSGGKSKKDDPDLNDLDDLFPKQYRAPQEATTRSINESLNNSKSNTQNNSLGSSQKDQSMAVDSYSLKQALRGQMRRSVSAKRDKQRSSSFTARKRSPSPIEPKNDENRPPHKKQEAKKKKKEKQVQDTSSPATGPIIEILRAEPPKPAKKKKEQQPQQSKKKKKDEAKEEKKEEKKEVDEPKEKEIHKVNLKSQILNNNDQMNNFIPQQNPMMFMPPPQNMPMMNQQMIQQQPQMEEVNFPYMGMNSGFDMPQNMSQNQLFQQMQMQQQQQQNTMQIDMIRLTIQQNQQMQPMMNIPQQQLQQRDDNMQPMQQNFMQAQFSQMTINNNPAQLNPTQAPNMQMFNNPMQQQNMMFENYMKAASQQQASPYPPQMFMPQENMQQMASRMFQQQQQQPQPIAPTYNNDGFQQMLKAQQQMFMQHQLSNQGLPPNQAMYMSDAQQQQAQFNQMNQYYQQQQKLNHLKQLRIQGYIINDQELMMLFNTLSLQELNHVHEFYEVLDAQILKLQQDQEQKLSKTDQLRQISFQLIANSIKGVYAKKGIDNQVKVEMYGSMATGLAIDSSDLDILVHDFVDHNSPRFIQMTRLQLIEEMQMLHESFDNISAITQNTLIDTASVPVIKLKINLVELCESELKKNPDFEVDPKDLINEEEISVLNVDITLDEPKKNDDPSREHLGLQCCKYIKNLIKNNSKMKTLVLVFKKFLSLKGLNRPFSGGLSSYGLIQMILALLKQEQEINDQLQDNNFGRSDLSVGMIFKHFIHEFGNIFQSHQKGIDHDGKIYDRDYFTTILHAPNCNLNQPQDEFQFDNQVICTCGQVVPEQQPRNDDNLGKLIHQLITGQQQQEEKEERKRAHIQQGPQLIIVDPLNKFNNIGKSSYNFAVIQEEFRQVYIRLNEELIRFVKLVAARPSNQASEPTDMIDGLIPRVLQIDYKIQQQEEIKVIKQPEEKKQNEQIVEAPALIAEEDLKPKETPAKKKQTQQAKQTKKKKQQTQNNTKQRKK